MANLMSIPEKIRMQIWSYVLPEEVELSFGPSPFVSHLRVVPGNPKVPLMMLCKKAAAEVEPLEEVIFAVRLCRYQPSQISQFFDRTPAHNIVGLSRVKLQFPLRPTVPGTRVDFIRRQNTEEKYEGILREFLPEVWLHHAEWKTWDCAMGKLVLHYDLSPQQESDSEEEDTWESGELSDDYSRSQKGGDCPLRA